MVPSLQLLVTIKELGMGRAWLEHAESGNAQIKVSSIIAVAFLIPGGSVSPLAGSLPPGLSPRFLLVCSG